MYNIILIALLLGYLVLLVALGSAALYCHNEKERKKKKNNQAKIKNEKKLKVSGSFLQHRGFTSITIDYANEHRITKRTAIASGL